MSTTPENNVIDISLGSRRKRIRIDNDDNRILLLNTTDNNILYRITEIYPKLTELENSVHELMSQYGNIADNDTELDIETAHNAATKLKQCDDDMKGYVDYIFDSNVSEICCDGGSMYDVIDGRIRYDVILDALGKLYSEAFEKERKKLEAQKNKMKKHTSKYNK